MSAMKEVVLLYPLTAEDIAAAVRNTGYTGYKARDFAHGLECDYVGVREGKPVACYSYTYIDTNEGCLEIGRVYVNIGGDGKLTADW